MHYTYYVFYIINFYNIQIDTYSHMPRNDILVSDGPHVRQRSRKISTIWPRRVVGYTV